MLIPVYSWRKTDEYMAHIIRFGQNGPYRQKSVKEVSSDNATWLLVIQIELNLEAK